MKQSILLTLCILIVAPTSYSDTFVDTGTPTGGSSANSLGSGSWIAAAFSTSTNYNITEISAYFGNPDVTNETQLTMALYANDAGGQIPGSELYTTQLDVPYHPTIWLRWEDVSGLNWYIPEGTYWVSFEVRTGDGDNYAGSMPKNPPSPLGDEAWSSNQGGTWNPWDTVDFGVRMTGDVVPEPAVALLFGTGLLTAFVLRRNQKSRADSDD